jgi:hypothetical protein
MGKIVAQIAVQVYFTACATRLGSSGVMKVLTATKTAVKNTSQTAMDLGGVAAGLGVGFVVRSGINVSFKVWGQQPQGFVNQGMERGHTLHAQNFVQAQLGDLPVLLNFSALLASSLQAMWTAERDDVDARIAARGGVPGLARPEQLHGKTGLQVMQAMLAGEIPYPFIAQTMDFSIMEVAEGRAVFQGTPQLRHDDLLGV